MSQPTVNHHCHREHWRGDNSKVPPYLSFVDQSLVKRILQTIWSGAYIFLLLECIDWRYLFFFCKLCFELAIMFIFVLTSSFDFSGSAQTLLQYCNILLKGYFLEDILGHHGFFPPIPMAAHG